MDYERILLHKKDAIATITLNVPEKLNPVEPTLVKNLSLAIDEVAKDSEMKVLVITGAGRAFSAGGDIEYQKAMFEGTFPEESLYEKLLLYGEGVADSLIRINKPTIAAVNGPAIAAGFGLILACDIRIASEKAKFGSLFINMALIPDGGITYLLPMAVGTSKALELMYTGNIIDAAEAERLGIVNKVVPHDELMNVTLEMATKIANQPPIAIALTKKLVYQDAIENINRYLAIETYTQKWCLNTEDHRESALAFLEKRPRPQYKGK